MEGKMWSDLTELTITVPCIAVGLALGHFSAKAYCNYKTRYSSFLEIEQAKTSSIADLHSLLCSSSSKESELFVVRGLVQPKVEQDVFVHQDSGQNCVVLKEFLETMSLRLVQPGILHKSCQHKTFTSMQTIPFILTEIGSDHTMSVSLIGSTHSLPLTRMFHQLEDICEVISRQKPYPDLVDYLKPIGVIEKMILPVGKEITAIGICSLQDGNPQIKACQDITYFLSEKTRDDMLTNLKDEQEEWLYYTLVLGSLSLGILCYIFTRNWRRWKRRNQQRRVDEEGATDKKI